MATLLTLTQHIGLVHKTLAIVDKQPIPIKETAYLIH